MLEQPAFGRRLKRLRRERGISQATLAGGGMSTGYLSRLESGARNPTERAVAYLARQLGVDVTEFEEQQTVSLAQALTIVTSIDSDSGGELLETALAGDDGQDLLLRWQALWLLAQWKRRHGEHAKELEYLEELVTLGDEVGLPELRVRALTQLARCLRASGDIVRAVDIAVTAHRVAGAHELTTQDVALVLLALVSVEAEAGRLPDARAHSDELLALVEGRSDALWAEALWTAASLRVRQGDFESAQTLLDQALHGFQSRENLVLWLRLRVAAARLHLQKVPSEVDVAQRYVEAIESGLPFAGTPALEQELMSLKADLAFREGRYMDAREMLGRIDQTGPLMSYRDRMRLHVLDNRLRIVEGHEEEGLRDMQNLAQQAHATSNIDLAADIWRIAAETLVEIRSEARTGPKDPLPQA
ncbi:helix-turn-helix domain-containing protein [Streptomyces sp.]|uniref:helix-turn-helix domain-containing protein n=1 Tax=Streptomyces sp. TaxID=1931 RepID=UPI0028120666|nr:helix-turn-helix domain-containing protein [Streptomyces sp.]